MTKIKETALLTFEEAKAILPRGKMIHTFRQAGNIIIGADWPRSDVLAVLKKYQIRKTGPMAAKMKHGIAIEDKHGPLFIETISKEKP